MAVNAVERQAQKLNQILRTDGKRLGKSWRQSVRALLSQTFDALNAKPIDGALCQALATQIEAELARVESGENSVCEIKIPLCDEFTENDSKKIRHSWVQDAVKSDEMSERMGVAHSSAQSSRIGQADSDVGEARIGQADSDAGGEPPDNMGIEKDDAIGLFDLIRVQVRCFFILRACVKPPYIGLFVRRATRHAEATVGRIERFIAVLSKDDAKIAAKTEVELGYDDDLLKGMPERGLVLHPKKKKKS